MLLGRLHPAPCSHRNSLFDWTFSEQIVPMHPARTSVLWFNPDSTRSHPSGHGTMLSYVRCYSLPEHSYEARHACQMVGCPKNGKRPQFTAI